MARQKDIRVEEVPVPAAPGPDEVQVEVEVHFVSMLKTGAMIMQDADIVFNQG